MCPVKTESNQTERTMVTWLRKLRKPATGRTQNNKVKPGGRSQPGVGRVESEPRKIMNIFGDLMGKTNGLIPNNLANPVITQSKDKRESILCQVTDWKHCRPWVCEVPQSRYREGCREGSILSRFYATTIARTPPRPAPRTRLGPG